MLPISNYSSSPDHPLKKPKHPPDLHSPPQSSSSSSSLDVILFKSYFLSPLSRHPRSCLILSLLLLQLLILSLSHYLPFSLSSRLLQLPPPSSSTLSTASISAVSTVPSPPPTYISDPPSTISTSVPPVSNSLSSVVSNAVPSSSLTAEQSPLQPNLTSETETDPQCPQGEFYVYEIPSEFNYDIYKNCDKLSPWGSRCAALSNGGFGRQATGIERIIPANLTHAWYWTDQFASEIIFHNRMLHHKCRTLVADTAAAYYIPFYAGLAVGKYLWSDYTAKDRDQHCERMLQWLQTTTPYFNRSNGWDHFLVMGRITWDFRRSKDQDWGSRCIYIQSMRNITRLLIERNRWDYFDIGVPYPSGFHPSTESDVVSWQNFVKSRERHTLFCFAGATRSFYKNDFRALLLSQCRDSGKLCRAVNCSGTRCANGTSEILETFLDSDFCLQPRGDSFTRRSIFDCMVAGSIPVFFWRRSAYFQYEWFLPEDPKSYSVFIHRNEVKNGTSVRSVLERFSRQEVRKMREKVVEFIPKFVYSKPDAGLPSIKDAVDLAVDGVLRRIKDQEENGYKW